MSNKIKKSVSKILVSQAHSTKPKLVIMGRGKMDGRGATLLRCRPSLIQELKSLAMGQTYLLLDLAIQSFIAELKARPESDGPLFISASAMDPSVYDRELLEESGRTPKKRRVFRPLALGNAPPNRPSH